MRYARGGCGFRRRRHYTRLMRRKVYETSVNHKVTQKTTVFFESKVKEEVWTVQQNDRSYQHVLQILQNSCIYH